MPRKSAAAPAMLDPRGQRLEPPPGLSEAERAAFEATVRSVRPNHFADEDMPLLVAYAAAIAQERAIARDLEAVEEAEDDEKTKQGPPAERPRAGCGQPDAAGEGVAPRGDSPRPDPQPPAAWHGRAERPAAVGIPALRVRLN